MPGATCGAGDAQSSGTPDLPFCFCESVIASTLTGDYNMFLQTILDVTNPRLPIVIQDKETACKIETVSRNLCHALHLKRSSLLGLKL